ncbi:hypothetical protein HU200_045073 [Digitaria exilis]|uniref:Uncharacterized protein n=1 Tax=Digitaria exilis TaxID=1010633 RepID=A0A835EDP1_9POAL|nr:hypothetical protein HU200_045073 [Digitaria exilis]
MAGAGPMRIFEIGARLRIRETDTVEETIRSSSSSRHFDHKIVYGRWRKHCKCQCDTAPQLFRRQKFSGDVWFPAIISHATAPTVVALETAPHVRATPQVAAWQRGVAQINSPWLNTPTRLRRWELAATNFHCNFVGLQVHVLLVIREDRGRRTLSMRRGSTHQPRPVAVQLKTNGRRRGGPLVSHHLAHPPPPPRVTCMTSPHLPTLFAPAGGCNRRGTKNRPRWAESNSGGDAKLTNHPANRVCRQRTTSRYKRASPPRLSTFRPPPHSLSFLSSPPAPPPPSPPCSAPGERSPHENLQNPPPPAARALTRGLGGDPARACPRIRALLDPHSRSRGVHWLFLAGLCAPGGRAGWGSIGSEPRGRGAAGSPFVEEGAISPGIFIAPNLRKTVHINRSQISAPFYLSVEKNLIPAPHTPQNHAPEIRRCIGAGARRGSRWPEMTVAIHIAVRALPALAPLHPRRILLGARLLPPQDAPGHPRRRRVRRPRLFRRAILSSSSATPTPPTSAASYFLRRRPSPKIAFLFSPTLTLSSHRSGKKFFRGHRNLFNLYVHADPYSVLELRPTPSFRGRFVPAKATQRASPTLISAARRLLATALLDDPTISSSLSYHNPASAPPISHPLQCPPLSETAGPHSRHRSFIEIMDNMDN